jgi:hypothetical protein
MLNKKEVIDLIQILEDGTMQIRKSTIIEEDGIELSRTYHRHCKHPGDDVTNEDSKVKSVSTVIWTPQVINDYQEKITSKLGE